MKTRRTKTSKTAPKKNEKVYVDAWENEFGIFGEESGHCYVLYGTEEEANEHLNLYY